MLCRQGGMLSFQFIQLGSQDAQIIRVTIQRLVWDDEGNLSREESIDDPKVYQKFFDRLSKSIFLEMQAI